MTEIEIAQSFARHGFWVFPLYGVKKLKPYGWAGNSVSPDKVDLVIAATNDPEEVAKWPSLLYTKYKNPMSGFGILGNTCVILDIDIKDGRDGLDSYLSLIRKNIIKKPNMVTLTKSGGLHCFYRRPANYNNLHIKSLVNIIIQGERRIGIDLRGNGGFVVGPQELVETFDGKPAGNYWCKGLRHVEDLVPFPESIIKPWCKVVETSELDTLTNVFTSDDFMSKVRRGEIPDFIPKGSRNSAFFVFANVMKSKGVPIDVTRYMMETMAQKVEEPETLKDSVNIEEMLARVYVIQKTSPYDVAVDLLHRGLMQLTSQRNHLHYILLEDNPYFTSKSSHDEKSMRTLLMKYQSSVEGPRGGIKVVNPMDIVTRIMGDEHRADFLGFKPNTGPIFTAHNDPGSRRFLNTYRPVIINKESVSLSKIWDQFTSLIERLFGSKDSPEYQLGLDFLAWLIQVPEVKPSIAPFLLSFNRGVGKSLLFNILTQVFGTSKTGDRQARIVKIDEITGRFFDPTGCIINLIDEVQFPVYRDMRKESVTFWRHLKNLITAETVSVEIKGGSTFQLPNSAAIMMAGNMGNSFPIEEFDRRLWVIDANAPHLPRGVVDDLFDLVRGTKFGPDERQNILYEIRYGLSQHIIATDLSSIIAPMSEVKKELYMGSLTHVEEWFVRYFEDSTNMFSQEPVISYSAFLYLVNTLDPIKMTRLKDDPEVMWRDMRRRGYLRPIRVMGNPKLSRQFAVPWVNLDGKVSESEKREILYTTRSHGVFDNASSKEVLQAFNRNLSTIRDFKMHIRGRNSNTLINSES